MQGILKGVVTRSFLIVTWLSYSTGAHAAVCSLNPQLAGILVKYNEPSSTPIEFSSPWSGIFGTLPTDQYFIDEVRTWAYDHQVALESAMKINGTKWCEELATNSGSPGLPAYVSTCQKFKFPVSKNETEYGHAADENDPYDHTGLVRQNVEMHSTIECWGIRSEAIGPADESSTDEGAESDVGDASTLPCGADGCTTTSGV